MKFLLFQIFIVIVYHPSLAQESTIRKIQGVITDATDGKPIPDAIVYVKHHDNVGCFSNLNGEFSLTVPAQIQDAELVVSALGYSKTMVNMNTFTASFNILNVSLNRMPILLNEVTVTAQKYDLEEICQMALENFHKNYPNKNHVMEGFYRKVSTNNLQYTGLVEAFVRIKDTNYRKGEENIQIAVVQARHGDNYLGMDSIAMKILKKMNARFNVSSPKSLNGFYESNYIRLYNKLSTVFNDQPFNALDKENRLFHRNASKSGFKEEFKLDSISATGRDTIFHIDYKCLSPTGRTLDGLKLSININDYAMIGFSRGVFGAMVQVKFTKQTDNRYYPTYIKRISTNYIQNDKNKSYQDIETLEIKKIQTAGKMKIKNVESRARDFDIYKFQYDSSFWKKYMDANPHPLNKDVLRSLEKIKPLAQQFENH